MRIRNSQSLIRLVALRIQRYQPGVDFLSFERSYVSESGFSFTYELGNVTISGILYPLEQDYVPKRHISYPYPRRYLMESNLSILNRRVSAFFDLAKLHALNHEQMYIRDWLPQMDDFANRYGKGILHNAGSVSRQVTIEKATKEYNKYKARIADLPTPAERDYLESLKQTQKQLKAKRVED